jgi:hypothetical protein
VHHAAQTLISHFLSVGVQHYILPLGHAPHLVWRLHGDKRGLAISRYTSRRLGPCFTTFFPRRSLKVIDTKNNTNKCTIFMKRQFHTITPYHPTCFHVNPSPSGVHFYHCLHKIKRCTMNDSLRNICSLSNSDVTAQVCIS